MVVRRGQPRAELSGNLAPALFVLPSVWLRLSDRARFPTEVGIASARRPVRLLVPAPRHRGDRRQRGTAGPPHQARSQSRSGGQRRQLAGRDQENTTFDIAEKLKKKLRKSIITDFSTLASGKLVQGSGHAEVAEFQTWGYPQHRLQQRTAVIHTQAVTREGRVDLCLFGSLKNLRGFAVPEEDSVGGWTSSAAR